MKPKRKVSIKTAYQKEELEKEFLSRKYLEPYESIDIAKRLNLEDKQVRTWFDFKRKIWNQTHDESQQLRKVDEKRIYEPPEHHNVVEQDNVIIKSEIIEESNTSFSEPEDKPLKRKRRWDHFSAYQKQELEKEFLNKQNIEPKEISDLANKLGLLDNQLINWFKKRRIKWNQTNLDQDSEAIKRNSKIKMLARSFSSGMFSFLSPKFLRKCIDQL